MTSLKEFETEYRLLGDDGKHHMNAIIKQRLRRAIKWAIKHKGEHSYAAREIIWMANRIRDLDNVYADMMEDEGKALRDNPLYTIELAQHIAKMIRCVSRETWNKAEAEADEYR